MKLAALTLSMFLLQSPGDAAVDGPKAQVLAAMTASLPASLVATDLKFVGRSQWSDRAKVIISWDRGMQEGLRTATVNVLDGDHSFKTWASTRLSKLRPVLVLVRDMKAGDELGPKDVRTELRAVRARRALDLAPQALVGQSILTDVKRGAVLLPMHVALPARLAAGTEVRVLSTVAGVSIRASGTLVSAVRPGAPARVRIGSSSKVITGRLVDTQTFVVEVSK